MSKPTQTSPQPAPHVAWGDGSIRVEMVRLDQLKPNPWNPNKMTEGMFEKERLSIRTHGFVQPIMARISPQGEMQIVDGEHRWRAAQLEGMVEVPVVNLGAIGDERAKKLTIISNELRGAPEPVLLAQLVKELSATQTVDQLSAELPMTPVELDTLIRSTEAFDWDAAAAALPDAPVREQEHKGSPGVGAERKFQLGVEKGSIPLRLHDELMEEFRRSAKAIGSSNVELVLRDWAERLRATAPQVDAIIEQNRAAQTQPGTPSTKRRKGAP